MLTYRIIINLIKSTNVVIWNKPPLCYIHCYRAFIFIKMKLLKKEILQLLEDNTTDETSSTGTTGERIMYAPYYDIVDDIVKMVSHNFEPKKCMPDGINSKEEHEEYLKAIGYEKYVKNLQHHKDTTVGLYAFDKELDSIFENIPNKEGCKTVVEAYLVQQIEYLKSIVFRIS